MCTVEMEKLCKNETDTTCVTMVNVVNEKQCEIEYEQKCTHLPITQCATVLETQCIETQNVECHEHNETVCAQPEPVHDPWPVQPVLQTPVAHQGVQSHLLYNSHQHV